MKTSRLQLKLSALAGSLLLSVPWSLAAQGTIVFGTRTWDVSVPFGSIKPGQAYFTSGQYQQIYDANGFPSALLITRIAFAQDISNAGTDTYNLSLGLGTTLLTPGSVGKSFDTNFTTVFSGSLSPVFTSAPGDFDFAINLPAPFYYDPVQGNLLLNVTMFSAVATNSAFAFDGASSSMGRLWNRRYVSLESESNSGLVTEFTVIPEPSPLGLLCCGGLLLVAGRFRRAKAKS